MTLEHLTPAAQILAGIVLILFGRSLFWLFVAVIGFSLGLQFGPTLFPGTDPTFVLIASLALGLLGAILAIFLQKAAVVLAGAISGGLVALQFATAYHLANPLPIVVFLVAAIICALLVAAVFEWALIILSSLFGASLVTEHLTLDAQLKTAALIALLILGLVVQGGLRQRRLSTTRPA